MLGKKLSLLTLFVLVGSMLLTACEGETVEVTRVVTEKETVVETVTVVETERETVTVVETEVETVTVVETEVETVVVEAEPEAAAEPVTATLWDTSDIPGLDPQIEEDVTSINAIENLFVHLTNVDPETAEILPEAATDWEISDDGLVYTFKIRTDIPWVKHNPVTLQTIQEVDEEGNPRFVTAHDFVYGIKRACNPATGSYYSSVIAPQILGCEDVLYAEDPENISQELIDAIGVSAPDDGTLVVQLAFPASFFLAQSAMWTLAATPQWAIEDFGEDWVEAGNIVTNGRFVLHEWVHNVRRTFLRNPLMPEDMRGDGNVERMIYNVVPDWTTGYALWLDNEVDESALPPAEVEAHLAEFPDETIQDADLTTFYIAFRETKPPFDDARVRRAFGAAFDRQAYVTDVIQSQGLPMKHFAPPGIFGAPPIDEVGVGFDPEFARQQLADAGYPDCEGFPQVSLLGYTGEFAQNQIEYAQAQWEEHLGCSADLVQIEQLPFRELLAATKEDVPDEEAPHMWTAGWGPDYADENNWVGDVVWCQGSNLRFKRTCNEIDDLILEAREESDPAARIELYLQIEEMLYGPEGETPFFPIYTRIQYRANHAWLQQVRPPIGGQPWYLWKVDQAAQQAAK